MDVHLTSQEHIAALPKRTRQRYSDAFKQQLVERALQPGVSVAGLALENSLNANLLRMWITKHHLEQRPAVGVADDQTGISAFVRVPIARRVEMPAASVQVRLPNGVQIDLAHVDSETLTTWLLALNALPCSNLTPR